MFGSTISAGGPERQAWRTPPELFNDLNKIFRFTVDACASHDNTLLTRYWTAEDDATRQDWTDEIVFCNPPFRATAAILPKCREAKAAVFLLPLTALMTRYVGQTPPDAITWPPYRIKYLPPLDLQTKSANPSLGTVALLYGADEKQMAKVSALGWLVAKLKAF